MFDLQTENQLFKKFPSSLRQVKDRLLDPDSVIQKLTSGSLNSSLTPDMTLMGEMQMMDDVIQTVSCFVRCTVKTALSIIIS